VECHLGDGTARGPGARALRIYCCAGASFPDLLLVVCRGRVLASHWMTVELLHIRIVARDGRPRGSSFTGGVAFRRGPPFRYLPLCCSSLLRTRPTFSNGSPLLRRSALRRSPSFWSRSFFPSGSRFGSTSLTLRHCHLLQGPRTLPRQCQSARSNSRRMLTDPLPTLPAMRVPLAYVCESARAACGRSFWRGIPALLCRYICATSTVLIATSPSVASSGRRDYSR
jgi:hypothetical protein